MLARESTDIGDGRMVLIHIDGDEGHAVGCSTEIAIGIDELLRDNRADIDAVRVHEFKHDDTSSERRQRDRTATIIGQREIVCRGWRNGRECHDTGQLRGD